MADKEKSIEDQVGEAVKKAIDGFEGKADRGVVSNVLRIQADLLDRDLEWGAPEPEEPAKEEEEAPAKETKKSKK